jgi:dihydrofolate reductase
MEAEFAKTINTFNKVALSRSSLNLTWNNSQLINYSNNQSFISVINDLKKQTGKNISVESGIGMWHMFLLNNLYDELLLYVHPAIVGDGVKLFNEEHFKANLRLLSSKRIDKGVVILHYEKGNY